MRDSKTIPPHAVTFLFTDIEGSTKRWEALPAAMAQALAQHDDLLRWAIEAHGGHVFKTVGDAFYAVFTTAPGAVAAALQAQALLHHETWDAALGALCVRIALHTGVAEERNGDYFGPPLNRVARLLSAGHGGQILLSHVTQELVRDQLPAGVELRDMGEHRLKDLIRPERIFQLVGPDLPVDFPPLKTLDYHPNNLPLQPNPFVGREREVDAVRQRLLQPAVRLVTLTGVGGTGKTRLALQVAADLFDTFRDGVWFVDLAPISDPNLVISTIATTLGVREVGGHSLLAGVQAYLRNKRLLLVLDNFEQVQASALVVAELIRAAPEIKVLATSRAPLRLQGEREISVPPLAVPRPPLPAAAVLPQYEAVRLFIERAQEVKADFEVTNANAPAVAEICARLDGLPLAIELAAARSKLLPPEVLLQRLSSRLKLLTGGAKDLPARQQTLRNAIDWSFDLLEAHERTLFLKFAIFVGGCTLEAVESVCTNLGGREERPGDDDEQVLDTLQSLVDKSLIWQGQRRSGEPRFVMLDTIREYAQERLEDDPQKDVLARRHAQFFLALSETAAPRLTGSHQRDWLQRLETEHDNLRAALQWTLDRGEFELAARISVALWRFWQMRGYLREGYRWLEAVLSHGDALTSPMRASATLGAAVLAERQGSYQRAAELFEQARQLAREQGDKRGLAFILNGLGNLAMNQRDIERARPLYEESLALRREMGDTQGIANSLNNLGWAAVEQGEYALARSLLIEGRGLLEQLGDTGGLARALHSSGIVALETRDYGAAGTLFSESLALRLSIDDKWGIAESLEGMAGLAAVQSRSMGALRLAGAAAALRERIGAPLFPVGQVRLARWLAPAQATLSPEEAATAWEAGRALTPVEALATDVDAQPASGESSGGARA